MDIVVVIVIVDGDGGGGSRHTVRALSVRVFLHSIQIALQ